MAFAIFAIFFSGAQIVWFLMQHLFQKVAPSNGERFIAAWLMLWSGGSCWRSSSSSLRPLVSLNEANEKRRAVRDREWISWKDGVPDIAHTGTFPVWRHWGGKQQQQVGWWWPYVFISMYLRIILAIERRWNVISCFSIKGWQFLCWVTLTWGSNEGQLSGNRVEEAKTCERLTQNLNGGLF